MVEHPGRHALIRRLVSFRRCQIAETLGHDSSGQPLEIPGVL
jgi:hypothetical protein